jgi:hypothetical protein
MVEINFGAGTDANLTYDRSSSSSSSSSSGDEIKPISDIFGRHDCIRPVEFYFLTPHYNVGI